MILILEIEVFDIRNILLFFYKNIDNYYRRVMVATLFLPPIVPKTSMVILVLVPGLILVGRRLLEFFFTRYINRGIVNRLIFLGVFIHLFCKFVSLKILGINFADA